MDGNHLAAHCRRTWEADALSALVDYIRIPNVSPAYDERWAEAGHMDRAVDLVRAWCAARVIDGLHVDVVRLDGRTPLILVEVDGDPAATTLLYGHVDKQPEMAGWRDGLGPWEPVREGDRLYGRGAADDGYAAFAALIAIEALQRAGGRHGRCVAVIEASEESGSPDLPAYMEHLADRIGSPSLVVGLDSGCGSYDRLWVTTSLRGLAEIIVTVDVLEEGAHSGHAGGVIPSSFRILRSLLSRIEDELTGRMLLPALHVDVPEDRVAEAKAAAELLGDGAFDYAPAEGARALGLSAADALVRRSWQPSLATVGMDGFPPTAAAGNVLRPFTRAKLSVRLPPTCDATGAANALVEALQTDPPPGARVTVETAAVCDGWHAPALAPWLATALDDAGQAAFAGQTRFIGEGGTIPFMGMLGRQFPQAQFVVTGVLGPGANAHGPNEFLHVPTAMRVTEVVARLLDAQPATAAI
jgi:acetylornithine deacetylase/succinyl-diaminopimelate desuccinylase-like protein